MSNEFQTAAIIHGDGSGVTVMGRRFVLEDKFLAETARLRAALEKARIPNCKCVHCEIIGHALREVTEKVVEHE